MKTQKGLFLKNSIFLFLSQYRFFGRLRQSLQKIKFTFGSFRYRNSQFIGDKKDSYTSLQHLFKVTQLQLSLALLFAIFLQIMDPIVVDVYEITLFKIPEESDYVTFLVTISGIGGVFIGLYYAAISSIGGSIYAKVPNNIRDLLAQERVGSVYMHFLSFVTFLGLSLVSLRVLGFDRILLAIPIMLISAGVGIIAFVKLGQRVFNLFDPTSLSRTLFEQLSQNLRMVVVGGYRWNDPAFQRHANKLALSNLRTLITLAGITKNEVHLNAEPFISLSKNVISFLLSYESSKKYIPSDSQWYEQKYEHKDWYRTDETRVSIAHQTGTGLQPEIINDKEWVETRVFPIIHDCLRINLQADRYNEVLSLLEYIDFYLGGLARIGRTKHAFEILEELGNTILSVVSPATEEQITFQEVLEKLAIIERFSSIPITIALRGREYVESSDPKELERKLPKINWSNEADIYQHGFPVHLLPQLEWLKPRLEFEVFTEGKKVTPTWYQMELIRLTEAKVFVENTSALIKKGATLYQSWVKTAIEAKRPWLSSAVMSRELEFWNKINHHMETWPHKWSLLSSEKKVPGLPWKEFDYENLQNDLIDRQTKLLTSISEHSLLLVISKRPEGFPDYAGQFLHTSGEALFDALLQNDLDLFESLFSKYLYGSLSSFDRLRPTGESPEWRMTYEFKLAVAPLLDLMTLSGYARLMADYHENEKLWSVVTNAWDKYLSEKEGESPLPILALSVSITGATLEIPYRSLLRTNWERRISHLLSAEVPRHRVLMKHGFGSYEQVDHKSALVRLFSQEAYSLEDGVDIFIHFYLQDQSGAEELDFGRKGQSIQNSLAREEKRDDWLKSEVVPDEKE